VYAHSCHYTNRFDSRCCRWPNGIIPVTHLRHLRRLLRVKEPIVHDDRCSALHYTPVPPPQEPIFTTATPLHNLPNQPESAAVTCLDEGEKYVLSIAESKDAVPMNWSDDAMLFGVRGEGKGSSPIYTTISMEFSCSAGLVAVLVLTLAALGTDAHYYNYTRGSSLPPRITYQRQVFHTASCTIAFHWQPPFFPSF
jgi:hypothetical protein